LTAVAWNSLGLAMWRIHHPWHKHMIDGELMSIPGWMCPLCNAPEVDPKISDTWGLQ
jgi:hypothetical protein